MKQSGPVYLVGAGPGDSELLTVKAIRCLEGTDVVVYDRLISQEILALVPRGATMVSVGKAPSHHPVPQAEINQLLVHLARSGRTIVRLKGGDPFIFGRGSEETAELAAVGVAVEVVPSITAAQGCAAACGVPLTHRGLTTGVRYITDHCRAGHVLNFDWSGLADPQTTLAIYMGRTNIEEITAKLIEHGLADDTPVMAIWNGTTACQGNHHNLGPAAS